MNTEAKSSFNFSVMLTFSGIWSLLFFLWETLMIPVLTSSSLYIWEKCSIIYLKSLCSLHFTLSLPFPVCLVWDFFATAIPMLQDFSVCLCTVPDGFYDLYSYLWLLFVKSEFAALHLAEAQEHLTFYYFCYHSGFFSPFLSYFLILLFSKMLTTGSLIPVLGNLQIHKIPFSF